MNLSASGRRAKDWSLYSCLMPRFTFAELGLEDERWVRFLADVPHDVYHLPAYLALEGKRMGGKATAALVEWGDEALLVPYVARDIEGMAARDLSSPYGYSGFLTTADATDKLEAITFLFGELRDRGYYSAFLRLHPILNASVDWLPNGMVHETGSTVIVNLLRPLEDIRSHIRKSELQQARRLQRRGLEVRFETGSKGLTDFYDIYLETMRRVDAAPIYFEFDLQYYLDLSAALGTRLTLCTIRDADNILSAKIYTESSGIVQNLLGGTRTDALKDQPSVLETIEAMRHFRERGAKVLHLGGGVGGHRDSLFHFKNGFSHEAVPYHTMRIILDQEGCERLSAARAAQLGMSLSELDRHGFFPPYRTQIP